jgi:hypothetical protein
MASHLCRDGWWHVRFVLGGAEKQRALGTTDVEEAREKRDQIIQAVEDKRAGKAPPVIRSWQDAVGGCDAHLRAQARAGEISESAVKRYTTSWDQITAALGFELDEHSKARPIPLVSITKATVFDFIIARREEERATSTILNDLTAWSHVMSYAAARGWIEDNFLRAIDRRKLVGQRRNVVTPPTDPEVAELAAEVSDWSPDMGKLICWLRQTGMRLAEGLRLRLARG